MIFYDAANMPANTETAPTGAFANSGWQHQVVTTRVGRTHSYLATIISPKHYITANHLGNGWIGTGDREIVTQPSFITGGAEETFTIRNGGNPQTIQWLDPADGMLKNTDLRVFEIWETFPSYAELFSQSGNPDVEVGGNFISFAEQNEEFVMTGYGDGRGLVVSVLDVTRGWQGDPNDRKVRWGRNEVDGIVNSERGLLLYCDFDALTGKSECHAMGRDSGGGWFIKDGEKWKLAGINYTVDSFEYGPPDPEWGGFRAAVFSGSGLYLGPTDELITPGDFYERSHTYATRVSAHEAALDAIIQPAKDTALLPPEERLERWVSDHGVSTGLAPDDDADGDGLNNLLEYLTESDPGDSQVRRSPLRLEMPVVGTLHFILVETLDLLGREITTTLEKSNDLTTWSTVTGTTEESNVPDPVTGIRTKVLSLSMLGDAKVYYRLKVEL